jgi:aminopeptidase
VADPRIEKWARALTGYSVEVKAGQTVAIVGHPAAEPLVRAVYREVVKAGAFPVLSYLPEGAQAELLAAGNDEQLAYISPVERFMRTEADLDLAPRSTGTPEPPST